MEIMLISHEYGKLSAADQTLITTYRPLRYYHYKFSLNVRNI